MNDGLRERAKEVLRAELAAIAFDVFAEDGFDGATADDVARRAGISRATFFRYFSSKEEAVVTAIQSGRTDFGVILRALDARPGEGLWDLLERTLCSALAEIGEDPARLLARIRMITAIPSLRARLAEKWHGQERSIVEALADRGASAAQARVLAVAALAAYDLTWREWALEPANPPMAVLADVFGRFRDLGAAI